jgi:NTP pyrophosphatase (non-canonical NTP hydrolase)
VTPNEYAAYVKSRWFAPAPHGIEAAALGIGGEAGEVVDEIKKHLYHDGGFDQPDKLTEQRYANVLHELGDLMYYAHAMMNELGVDYDLVTDMNRHKLDSRYGPPKATREAEAAAVRERAA